MSQLMDVILVPFRSQSTKVRFIRSDLLVFHARGVHLQAASNAESRVEETDEGFCSRSNWELKKTNINTLSPCYTMN